MYMYIYVNTYKHIRTHVSILSTYINAPIINRVTILRQRPPFPNA